jgi:condensin complex subunit 1
VHFESEFTRNLVKSAHLLLENQAAVKDSALKRAVLEVLVAAVLKQDAAGPLKTIILQDLNYFEWLAEPLAEFAKLLVERGEACAASTVSSQFVRDLLSQLGGHRFAGSGEASGTVRIVAAFLVHTARLVPREVLRNMAELIDQIDCESYVMRMAMAELIGLLLCHLGQAEERSEQVKAQTRSFLGVLEERLRDVNAFVRARVLHTLADVLKSNALPVETRPSMLKAVISRLPDKSSSVRRRVIQLLGDFMRSHPFCVEGGELSLRAFEERLADTERAIAALTPDDVEGEAMSEETNQKLSTLLVQKRYYSDAVQFSQQLEAVIPTLSLLLSSTCKQEVVDVIDFFVEAHAYRLDGASAGLRKMMHLIWERESASAEDGAKQANSVREYLLEAYKRVYLETDARLSGREKCDEIASNLLSIMHGISMAELASLEPILEGCMARKWISDGVIQSLFAMLGQQQKGALPLLAMLAMARPAAVLPRLDLLMRHGFGPSTTPIEARYTCMAIASSLGSTRLANDNAVFGKIWDFIRLACTSPAWFQVISEAVKTVYALASQPGLVCEAMIKELFDTLFSRMDESEVHADELARLLHLVGQVTVCESNHLELVERHWKAQREQQKTTKSTGSDELEMISGTAEDDFAELIGQVRDHELLYGEASLLAVFGPLVAHICSNQIAYPSATLQRIAALTLAKFMTISAAFCQTHLALFLTLLERSEDAVVRSNLVIAFGDLVQAFGRIIDENVAFLFGRLADPDALVRRNCLMVLTHLTLTGMIKIKGQIGDIAKCLLDEDPRIADLAKLFFHEIASKDTAIIYNHIPDMLSSLSASTTNPLPYADFQRLLRFIFEFIKKERQLESLLDRLLQRFRLVAGDTRRAREVAFCLSLCNFANEKALRKLIDAFPVYREALGTDLQTFRCFAEILGKARRSVAKGEAVKALLDEYEKALVAAGGDFEGALQQDDEDGLSDADDEQRPAKPKKTTAKGGKKPASRRHLPGLVDDEELASDEDSRRVAIKMAMEEDEYSAMEEDGDVDVMSGDEALPTRRTRGKVDLPKRQFGGGAAKPKKPSLNALISDGPDMMSE